MVYGFHVIKWTLWLA